MGGGGGGGGGGVKRLNKEISLLCGGSEGYRDGLWRWPGHHCCQP